MQLIPNPLIIPVGFVIGVLVAAPIGPVNVLCIRRTLEQGFWAGIAAGLGAVLGDGLLAVCAALGVSAISETIERHRFAISILGAATLLAFAAKIYFTPPNTGALATDDPTPAGLSHGLWDIPQTFLLTITNPGAVLGMFATLSFASTLVAVRTKIDTITVVCSIVAGSLAWWITLAFALSRLRGHLSPHHIHGLNRAAALLLVIFGIVLVAEAFWPFHSV